jgi:hypothetical protein
MDEVVANACRIANNEDIRSIHIAMGHRPGYNDLIRYRDQAAACGLRMTVIGSGGIALWYPSPPLLIDNRRTEVHR